MSRIEDAADLLGQLVDAVGNPDQVEVTDEFIERVAEALPDGPWDPSQAEEWSGIVDGLWEERLAQHRAAADKVRRDCQMTGHARVGDIEVLPNPEFVAAGGASDEVRVRQLRDWPTSPHWWVTLTDPDGWDCTYDQSTLSSWAALLSEARTRQTAWEARVQEDRRQRWARVHAAQVKVRAAEEELVEAHDVLAQAWAAWDQMQPAQEEMAAMSPAEFAAYRHLLGLTFEDIAHLLRVNPRTTRSWESGRDPVRQSVADQINELRGKHDQVVAGMVAEPDVVRVARRGNGGGWRIAALARALATRPTLRAEWEA